MNQGIERSYARRYESRVRVAAAPQVLFDYLDDHVQLAAHMMRSSPMMSGGKMTFEFDAGRGRETGSQILMRGRVLGLSIETRESVTERTPPLRKIWETEPTPRLLVIGAYRVGFNIAPDAQESSLCVFVDYDLPPWPWRLLGLLVGRFYVRWCAQAMARDAQDHFERPR